MGMPVTTGTYIIWFSAAALEVVVLFRGVRMGLARTYPFFYVYLACIFLSELLRFFCYEFAPSLYQAFYWHIELVLIVTSYAILVDVFRQALKYSPGVLRKGQKLLLIVFVVAASYAFADLLHVGFAYWPWATANVGRYLRNVEGAVLLAMLWLFGRYRVSFRRNLLGLTIGYSLVVGLDVSNLAFWFERRGWSSVLLPKLHSIIYVITLGIWCISLWSPQSEAAAPAESAIERDYAILACKTRTALGTLSARVARTLRP